MTKVRVVLVDDHPVVRQGVRSLLDSELGITVVDEAEDGLGAIEAVREHIPDLVVMDLSMATLNGVEATRRIIAEFPSVRVLCLSLHADEHLVSGMLEAGASGYILKEAAVAELVSAIRAVAAGQTYLSPTVAGQVVRDYVARRRADSVVQLTSREREVLQLIAEGHATKEIAAQLSISPKTVSTHRENIMKKLDLHDVVSLAKYAIRSGISTVSPDRHASRRKLAGDAPPVR